MDFSRFQWTLDSAGLILPEIVLVAGILLVTILDLFPRFPKTPGAVIAVLAMGASLGLAVAAAGDMGEPRAIFKGAAAHDGFGLFFRILFLGTGILAVFFSWGEVRRWTTGQGEFLVLLLSCVFGMLLMASANTLLMMFLTLEFVSVTSYILTGMRRRNRKSIEGSLKYILYGAAASGVMLFGMSFLYGLTGRIEVTEIGRALADREEPLRPMLAAIISVFIAGGFAYKMAAAPFHAWSPDVYEGAPTPVTAFFSVGPKIAGFAMFARFLAGVFQGEPKEGPFEWRIVIAAMAVLTMAVGNLVALWQDNLKRFLAYSGIAHAGYMLLAFVVFTPDSLAALMFYAVAYLVMNLGAFLMVMILERQYGLETIRDVRGIGWTKPALCALMGIFMFSLVGVPPFVGFMGKLLVFGHVVQGALERRDAWDALPVGVVLAGVLFSVVSLFYYARVVGNMVLRPQASLPEIRERTPVLWGLAWAMGIATLALFAAWGWLFDLCKLASSSLLGRT